MRMRRNPTTTRLCKTLDELLAAVGKPAQPQRAAAAAIARQYSVKTSAKNVGSWPEEAAAARELWEAYATRGLIPVDCVDNPARRFGYAGDTAPRRQIDAMELASDPAGVLLAEELARATFAAMKPYASATSRSVMTPPSDLAHKLGADIDAFVWVPMSRGARSFHGNRWYYSPPRSLTAAINASINELQMDDPARGRPLREFYSGPRASLASYAPTSKRLTDAQSVARRIWIEAELWRWAQRQGLRLRDDAWSYAELAGMAYRDLPNPYEPLLAIYCLGYATNGVYVAPEDSYHKVPAGTIVCEMAFPSTNYGPKRKAR